MNIKSLFGGREGGGPADAYLRTGGTAVRGVLVAGTAELVLGTLGVLVSAVTLVLNGTATEEVVGVALATAPPPSEAVAPHAVAGTGLPCWLYASGYSHPDTAVTYDDVSCESNHPFGVLTVTLAVKLGGGSVRGPRVAVYEGMSETWPVGTPARLVGGNMPNLDVEDGRMVPAPAPPVM